MTRTKHVGLLYKQLKKDSAKSRGGMPDYLMTFIKPGDNAEPIVHTPGGFPRRAMAGMGLAGLDDVNQSNVLNVKMAREGSDERHLCPLQLDVIDRALIMWSNPGNTVLSPFMGIGSEGVCSLKHGRKFIGTELKQSYWKQAARYLEAQDRQEDLFAREKLAELTILSGSRSTIGRRRAASDSAILAAGNLSCPTCPILGCSAPTITASSR
jgi:hypothetical protein